MSAVRPRVLVLDDDTRLIERVVTLLQSRHEVVISGRRHGRVAFLREIAPDLVLLGVRLPFPGGDEVLGAIRAEPPLGVPVLVLSGATQAQSRVPYRGRRALRSEQPALRRRRHRALLASEVAIGERRRHPAARRAGEESLLDEERLVDVLDGVALLADRRAQRVEKRREGTLVPRLDRKLLRGVNGE